MKLLSKCFLGLVLCFSIISPFNKTNTNEYAKYYIDLSNHSDDLFHVTFYPPQLTSENDKFYLPSTVPGVYKNYDYGRFVKELYAYDENGGELETEKIETNVWAISNPELIKKFEYVVEDTYDAEVESNKVSGMSGTGIGENYVLMNTFGVCGFVKGKQFNPVKLKIDYPEDWLCGTALEKDESGYFRAESFNHLIDSPFMLGELSYTSTKVNDIDVEIYVTYPNEEITADSVLVFAEDALSSASSFIASSPVDRYTFLMVFMDMAEFQKSSIGSFGALEHSYSSSYFIPAIKENLPGIEGTIAHEFFHIVIPLNIHSERIENFDFVNPIPSEHLWLYEGVTEWAADIMRLRSGVMTIEKYMKELSEKIQTSENFDPDYSFSKMSLNSYNEEGIKEYANIYYKGAITGTLLDIEILSLTNGQKGLREVILELAERFGKDKAFPEDDFYNIVVDMTHPDIEEFFNDYIKNAKEIDYNHFFNKIGLKYIPEKESEDNKPSVGIDIAPGPNNEIMINGMTKEREEEGKFKKGDQLVGAYGTELTFENIMSVLKEGKKDKVPGDKFTMKVRRDDEVIELDLEFLSIKRRHVFEIDENANEEQVKLREVWMKNLEI